MKRFILPGSIWAIGLLICAICAPLTVSVNSGVGIGLLIMIIGTINLMFRMYKEYYRIGGKMPFFFNKLFPDYPIIEDYDEFSKRLSGFRNAFSEFLQEIGVKENSELQEYSSQILWHCELLRKQRMERNNLSMKFISNRRAYTEPKNTVRVEEYFDGRYDVKEVYEEIDSTRIFLHKDKEIKKIRDNEVAHYTLLSAKSVGDGKVVCPNCGGIAKRSDLIDGCDFCGTKFTVEDMENSVGSFGFRKDFLVSRSKKDAAKNLIYPWVFFITVIPFVYFGFFGAFLYMEESIIARLITGIVAAGLLGLLGWFFVNINMFIIIPIAVPYFISREKTIRKMVYSSEGVKKKEKEIVEKVRSYDEHFSLQSFYGGIQNKLLAIHFAEKKEQINVFSEMDLSSLLDTYKNVVDVDVLSMQLCDYGVDNEIQKAFVKTELILRDFINGKISTRRENVEIVLFKSKRCKTQAVCAPSVLRCEKCGSSLSLMEGKRCKYCDNEIDMRKFDWTIVGYKIIM